jgi:hypothetical protein
MVLHKTTYKMLTDKEKEIALKHLGIFQRQKQKYDLYIEESKAKREELLAQKEKYPNDSELLEDLRLTEKNLSDYETQRAFTVLKIEAIETSL